MIFSSTNQIIENNLKKAGKISYKHALLCRCKFGDIDYYPMHKMLAGLYPKQYFESFQ